MHVGVTVCGCGCRSVWAWVLLSGTQPWVHALVSGRAHVSGI